VRFTKRPPTIFLSFSLVTLSTAVPTAYGHGNTQPTVKTEIVAAASVTYRSNNALLGGEALPTEQGIPLDDAQLFGTWA